MNEQQGRGHIGKMKFDSRKSAKRFVRRGNIKNQHPYRCSTCAYWHLGHIPHDVRYGAVGSSNFTTLPVGSGHADLRTHSLARTRVDEMLVGRGWLGIVACRVASNIALVQRTEGRNPTAAEIAEFGDEYWAEVGTPPADWRSGEQTWRQFVTNATMLALARKNWITMDSRGLDVRIGHEFSRMLVAA